MQPNQSPHRAGSQGPVAKKAIARKAAWQAKKKAQAGANRYSQAKVPIGAVTTPGVPLIYLNIPKSACTTIKNQLYFAEHGRYIDEPLDIHAHDGLMRSRGRTPQALRQFNRTLNGPHLVFTFVRHPGKRAYSCFSEKIFHDSKYSFPKIRNYITANYGLKLPKKKDFNYDLAQHRENFMAFLDFVKDNCDQKDNKTNMRVDAHWNRQTTILKHFQRYFVIDFIGRVEAFESQFRFVVEQFPLPHLPDVSVRFNEGPKPPFSFKQILSPEIDARLREIYAEDYELLGYASGGGSNE